MIFKSIKTGKKQDSRRIFHAIHPMDAQPDSIPENTAAGIRLQVPEVFFPLFPRDRVRLLMSSVRREFPPVMAVERIIDGGQSDFPA
jgi:hypothetical protein